MSQSRQRPVPRNVILVGDARKRLAEVPTASVDCVVTSPSYFQLRDYGHRDQIGLEDHVDEWVDELRLVMRGIARVLKLTGSVWLNLGDTYSRNERYGSPPKSLLMGPERLALSLIQDGWILRNKVIWAKTNTMPNPVRDRLSCSWEVIYLLTRSRFPFFDLDAVRVPHRSAESRRPKFDVADHVPKKGRPDWAGPLAGNNAGLARMKALGLVGHPLGKNPGDVWHLPISNYRGGEHHATFPPALVERPLLATCPEQVCRRCGQPWQREPARVRGRVASLGKLHPICECSDGWQPGLVLDPFCGVNTTGLVAERLGRDWLGIELNPAFARLAEERITQARGEQNEEDGQTRAA
jgi:site-specific DNA-methyltransferase (adenine-specific)